MKKFLFDKKIHWLPPRFLMVLKQSSFKFSSKGYSLSENRFLLNLQNSEGKHIGTVYEQFIVIKEKERMGLEKGRIEKAIRSRIANPTFGGLLPKVMDYFVETQENKIHVIVLMHYLGIPVLELDTEHCWKNINYWIKHFTESFKEMLSRKQMIGYIGPELLYAKEAKVKILDLDEILINTQYTMNIEEIGVNTLWRKCFLNLFPISVPPLFESDVMKHQVFLFAFSFLFVLYRKSFFVEYVDALKRGGTSTRFI